VRKRRGEEEGKGQGNGRRVERREGHPFQLRSLDPEVEEERKGKGKEGSWGWGVKALLFYSSRATFLT